MRCASCRGWGAPDVRLVCRCRPKARPDRSLARSLALSGKEGGRDRFVTDGVIYTSRSQAYSYPRTGPGWRNRCWVWAVRQLRHSAPGWGVRGHPASTTPRRPSWRAIEGELLPPPAERNLPCCWVPPTSRRPIGCPGCSPAAQWLSSMPLR